MAGDGATTCKATFAFFAAAFFAAVVADASPWRLRYREAAEWSREGWRTSSLPLGNGHFGAAEFGGTDVERIQLTEPSFQTRSLLWNRPDWPQGNMTDAADVAIEFGHAGAQNYLRELDLETGVATVAYSCGGTAYRREYFVSYRDKVGAMRFTASRPGALSFSLRVEIPYLDAPPPHDRKGSVEAKGNEIALRETSGAYGTTLAGLFRIVADGRVAAAADGSLRVEGATEAAVFYSLATDYRLVPGMIAPMHSRRDRRPFFGCDPAPVCERRVADACRMGCDTLKSRHVEDMSGLLRRSSIELGDCGRDAGLTTPELRRRGAGSNYLAALMWRLGKYLLASSSRPGTLPCSLQGVWSGPMLETGWGSGYWHNINVQMAYWPAFACGMEECFEAYADYCDAYRPATREEAAGYLRRENPAALAEPLSEDFWAIGTAAWPYEVMCTPMREKPNGHSGPGTGGLTTAMFADWIDFTGSPAAMERSWPVLRGMADFLSRTVAETDGLLLATFSASPEQYWRKKYPHTAGCAFDQQMIAANNSAFLRLAGRLGRMDDPVARRCLVQKGRYGGLDIGASGQIKEYREENAYGEIGDPAHRHVSQLCGLYPCALVTRKTPELLAAASRTLDLRGDGAHAWAIAHRMCCRARLGEGDKALELFGRMMREWTCDTLWAKIGAFQETDANSGAAAAIAEMLVQSHETDEDGTVIVDLLPALPEAWKREGSFKGLRVRGGWAADCKWRDGKVAECSMRPIAEKPAKWKFRSKMPNDQKEG